MSHQPFETWILDHEVLSTTDRRTLQAHVEACPQCKRLQSRWQAVHQELRTHRMVAPAPGFTQRWLASLAERRVQEQRKQAWRIFGILLGTSLLVLMLMAGYLMLTTSPTDWLVAMVRTVSSSANLLNLGVYAVQAWLSSTPLALNLVLWVYLTITIFLLSLVWVVIVWRTNIVGVFNK